MENFRRAVAAALLQNLDNERVLEAAMKLAELEMVMGNYSAAVELFGRIIPGMKRVLGDDDSRTLRAIELHQKARAAEDGSAGAS
jgi:hypothetical protein